MASDDEPLKILKVIVPHRFSGAERIAVYIAEGLQARGHNVIFACNGQPEFVSELQRRGLECVSTGIHGKADLRPYYRLCRIAHNHDADIIHSHLSSAALIGSLAGRMLQIPVLAHVHALNTRTCFRFADMLAACSRGVKNHLVRQGIAPERIRVIYNGIELTQLNGLRKISDVRNELNITDGRPVIGMAAHLTPKKGHKYLVRATAMLQEQWPGLLCYMLGEGERRQHLQQMARELAVSNNVKFLGFRRDAVDLMQAMDIIILPSIAKEGLGLCLVEAAALSKPVVGTDAPGINEVIVDNQTGFLVPKARADRLAEAIDRLLGNSKLRAEMGTAGRQRAEQHFTLGNMVDKTEAMYYELIGAKRGNRSKSPALFSAPD